MLRAGFPAVAARTEALLRSHTLPACYYFGSSHVLVLLNLVHTSFGFGLQVVDKDSATSPAAYYMQGTADGKRYVIR